jgi:splicing factor 45
MSLYGDLPQAKQAGSDEEAKPAAAKGWATTNKLTPAFRPKQAAAGGVVAVAAAARGGGRIGAGAGAAGRAPAPGRGAGRGPAPVTLHMHASSAAGGGAATGAAAPYVQQHSSSLSFLKALNGEPLQDEYDPSKPNDYEEIMKARAAQQRAAEEEAERAARLREAEQVRPRWLAGWVAGWVAGQLMRLPACQWCWVRGCRAGRQR